MIVPSRRHILKLSSPGDSYSVNTSHWCQFDRESILKRNTFSTAWDATPWRLAMPATSEGRSAVLIDMINHGYMMNEIQDKHTALRGYGGQRYRHYRG